MDPNANLEEQLKLAAELQRMEDEQEGDWSDWESSAQLDYLEAAGRLAELVLALSEWLHKGGFLPDRWVRRPPVMYQGKALAEQKPAPSAPERTVVSGSHGDFEVDAVGTVVGPLPEQYAHVRRVDLLDYRVWCKVHGLEWTGNVDILLVGYWFAGHPEQGSGYEQADDDARGCVLDVLKG